MVVRAKTRQRLVILVAVVVSLVLLAGTYYFYKRNQRLTDLAMHREQGVAAVQAGDYAEGVNQLGTYLNGRDNTEPDVEVLLLYAKAREHVEAPGGGHIVAAIDKLREALSHQPTNTQAKRDLMRLFTMTGRDDTEAMDRAEDLLNRDPSDAEALWTMVQCKSRARKYNEALSYAERYTRVEPLAFLGHLWTLDILKKLERSPEQIIGYTDRLLAQKPDEPRYQVLAACAGALLDDSARVEKYLNLAIKADPPDVDTANQVYALLVRLNRHDDARAYLGRAIARAKDDDQFKDRQLMRIHLVSLWEANRYQQMIKAIEDYKVGPTRLDSQILAMRVLSLRSLNRDPKEAEGPLTALRNRKDNTAEAWSIIFASGLLDGKLTPARAVEVCQQAVGVDENNPYLMWLLGNAHQSVGDLDLAVNQWGVSAIMAPGWAPPVVSYAKQMRRRGEKIAAHQAAQQACMRSQGNPDANITFAEASADLIDRYDDKAVADMRKRIEIYRGEFPTEPRLILVYAKVLNHQGDEDQFRVLVDEVMNLNPSPPSALFVQLADISRERELGLDHQLLDRAQVIDPNSPQVAMAQALLAAGEGEAEKGRLIIENARRNSNAPDLPEWRIVVIRYDMLHGKRIDAATWASLADDFPEALSIQRLVLNEPAAWDDFALIDRVVERLKQLTGEQGVSWRIHRARWLVEQGSTNAITDAKKMLEDVLKQSPTRFEAIVLLARCFHLQGNTSGAIEQYKSALKRRPKHLTTKLALANLYLVQKDRRTAMQLVEEIAAEQDVSPGTLRAAAALAVSAERVDLGLRFAQTAQAAEPKNVTNDLLLANIYRRNDQAEQAEAIYARVMENPTPAAIEVIGDYHAAQGRLDKARAIIAKLDTTDATPDLASVIRGSFELKYGDTERALAHYQAAADAAPRVPAYWGLLLGQQVRYGRKAEALTNLDRAAKANPSNKMLATAQANRQLLETLGDYNLFRSLLVSMVSDAKQQAPAIEALKVLEKTTIEQLSQREVEVAIRRVADRYPGYLPVQMVTIHLVQRQGRLEQAALLARQTMQAFPAAVEPAYLAAELYAMAGNWREAREASKEWRRRSSNQTLGADLMMAKAAINTGDAGDALELTRPYIAEAMADPDNNAAIIGAHCRALLAAGRAAEVEKMLVPLIADSKIMRNIWIQLALFGIDDEDSAVAWLERVRPLAVADAEEQVRLAQAYRGLDERFKVDTHTPRAKQILESLVAADDPAVPAIKALAMLEDAQKNTTRAITLYRRVLEKDDTDALSMNNLAMLLVDDPQSVNEAHELASRAAEIAPTAPAVQDTYAQVLSKLGRHDEAIVAMSKAVQLDPRNYEMWVRLGHIYLDAEDNKKANEVLEHLEKAASGAQSLPIEIRQSINGLRTRLISG